MRRGSRTERETERGGAAPTFGARFLVKYERLGGSLTRCTWAELQEIKRCDREGLIQTIRKAHSGIPWAVIRRIREVASPEELAEDMWRQRQAAMNSNAVSMIRMLFALVH